MGTAGNKNVRTFIVVAIIVLATLAGTFAFSGQNDTKEIPSSFDMRDSYTVTPVKNQGTVGTCWAFSISGALESEILLANGQTDTVYISPLYIVEKYFDASSYDPELDTDQIVFASNHYPEQFGGSTYNLVHTMVSDRTLIVPEIMAPYAEVEENYDTSDMDDVDSYLIITELEYFDNLTDVEKIKRNLLNGEAGVFCYKANANMNSIDGTTTENSGALEDIMCNHAVTLIGWDDTYPKEKFKLTPQNDGAWLVKNSWGTSDTNNGYQWVSYESTIDSIMFFTDICIQDGSKILYSYDNGCSIMADLVFRDSVSMSNVFTAECDQTLDGASFMTMEDTFDPKGEEYVMKVYLLDDGSSNPTDGRLLYSSSGTVDCNGMLHVGFDDCGGIRMNEGDRFSIVVDLMNEGQSVVVPLDAYEEIESFLHSYSVSHIGESWINDGNGWEDISASGGTNIRIKAYATSDVRTVAEIVSDSGNVTGSFQSFDDALDSYNSGTIVLKCDTSVEGPIILRKEVSLNLNGFKLTVTCEDGNPAISSNSPLQIKNGIVSVNGFKGISVCSDIDLKNVLVESIKDEPGVTFIALSAEGTESAINVNLKSFYTCADYGYMSSGSDIGSMMIADSNVIITDSYIGASVLTDCFGVVNESRFFALSEENCSISYIEATVDADNQPELADYTISNFIYGTVTVGKPIAFDSNGKLYSNIWAALREGVGTVTLIEDVEYTVFASSFKLEVPSDSEIECLDLAGHSWTTYRYLYGIYVSKDITITNTGEPASIEVVFHSSKAAIYVNNAALTYKGSNIELISGGVPIKLNTDAVLISDPPMTYDYFIEELSERLSLTIVNDEGGYHFDVSGSSEDGLTTYSGRIESDSVTSTIIGTDKASGIETISVHKYLEGDYTVTEYIRDGSRSYKVGYDEKVIGTDGHELARIVMAYDGGDAKCTVVGPQISNNIDMCVWEKAVSVINDVKCITQDDGMETTIEVQAIHSSKYIPLSFLRQSANISQIVIDSVVNIDDYEYKCMLNIMCDNCVTVTLSVDALPECDMLYMCVEYADADNSGRETADMLGNDYALRLDLFGDGQPIDGVLGTISLEGYYFGGDGCKLILADGTIVSADWQINGTNFEATVDGTSIIWFTNTSE